MHIFTISRRVSQFFSLRTTGYYVTFLSRSPAKIITYRPSVITGENPFVLQCCFQSLSKNPRFWLMSLFYNWQVSSHANDKCMHGAGKSCSDRFYNCLFCMSKMYIWTDWLCKIRSVLYTQKIQGTNNKYTTNPNIAYYISTLRSPCSNSY